MRPHPAKSASPERLRPVVAFLIGVLVPANCWWVVVSALRAGSAPTQVSLYFNAVFTVLALTGLNAVWKRFRPAAGLNRAELLAVYICVSIGSGLAGIDRIFVLMPQIGHAHRFATPENDWIGLIHRHVPAFLTISDPRVMDGYYNGSSSFYEQANLIAWLPVILWWSVFVIAAHLVKLTLNLTFRRQWVERERLTYPVIQLPLEMTAASGGMFRSSWMWVGLALGLLIDAVNGLNFLFPAVPSLGGKLFDLQTVLRERPWNAIGWSPLAVFPFAVGMSFFIPLDLAFSCWAFWLLWRAERLAFAAFGRGGTVYGGTVSYESDQSWGAYIGLAVMAVWMSRRHLARFWGGIRRPSDAGASGEPFSPRTVGFAFAAGFGFLMFVGMRMGMSWWVVFLFFVIWFAVGLAIARLRAELGSPVHDLHFIGPDEVLPKFFGTRRLGAANLVGFTYLYWMNRAHRSHGMPHQLEGFKLADSAAIPVRSLSWWMLMSAALGILTSFWAYAALAYQDGGSPGWGWESFNRLDRWLNNPASPNFGSWGFIGIGFGATLLLAAMRMKFLWWGLHPVGYAISGSWAINPMIGSIFVGWFCKWSILRFGGMKAHRSAIPFFLGIILGEFLAGTFWSLLGIALDRPMYRFLF